MRRIPRILYVLLLLSCSIVRAQEKAKVGLEFRSMAISTDNQAPFQDAFAWGSSFAAAAQSPSWKRFSLQAKASVIVKHITSNLALPDSITKLPNRYEVRLFDVEHLQQNPMFRLEEANVQWQQSKTFVVVGMQRFQTPFLNAQDGFLRPNTFAGAKVKTGFHANMEAEAAWLSHVLVRSTDQWYSIAKSVGIYGVGVDENGKKSGYAKQISSKGVGIGGFRWKLKPALNLQIWNTFAENVSNTAFLQADWKQKSEKAQKTKKAKKAKKAPAMLAGVQVFWQRQVGNGGNEQTALQYYPKTSVGGISSQAGIAFPNAEITVAYTHIGKSGRFLMPREWGREPFYTFITRERNEGMGGVNAWKANLLLKPRWGQLEANYGFYDIPSDLYLNKYQLPSYHHVRIDMRWQPSANFYISGRWTHKWHQSKPLDAKWVYNKVDLSIWEIVFEVKR